MKKNVLRYASATDLGNFCGCCMSCCVVGNVLIPPKEKAIVPNAKDNDKNVGCSCSAVCFSDKVVIIAAKIRTAPMTVAEVAATATGLKWRIK